MNPTIITVANNKGGVGKTVTATNLSDGLARYFNKSVLLVDLDPQGQCASALGQPQSSGVYSLLTMPVDGSASAYVRQFVQTARPSLDLLPGDRQTALAQAVLNHPEAPKPVGWIREALLQHFSRYDYIILDTAPSLGGIQERALFAADRIILPSPAEALGADGLRQAFETIKRIKEDKGWKGNLAGILPTFFTDRQREHRLNLEMLQKKFGGYVLAPIHRAAILAECPAYAQTIFERSPHSKSADEYLLLAKTILKG